MTLHTELLKTFPHAHFRSECLSVLLATKNHSFNLQAYHNMAGSAINQLSIEHNSVMIDIDARPALDGLHDIGTGIRLIQISGALFSQLYDGIINPSVYDAASFLLQCVDVDNSDYAASIFYRLSPPLNVSIPITGFRNNDHEIETLKPIVKITEICNSFLKEFSNNPRNFIVFTDMLSTFGDTMEEIIIKYESLKIGEFTFKVFDQFVDYSRIANIHRILTILFEEDND